FARFKTCELRRLMEGGNAIRALDQRGNLLWSVRRNPKADVYRGHQLPLEILVIDSHCSLERADEVADDIFRRIVEKCGEAVRPPTSGMRGARRLPMMIPGMEPTSSDPSRCQLMEPSIQWPSPATSVSGTACAMSDPTMRVIGMLG